MEVSTQHTEHTQELKHYFFKVFGNDFETKYINAKEVANNLTDYIDLEGYWRGEFCNLTFYKGMAGGFVASILSSDRQFMLALEMLLERMHEGIVIDKQFMEI